MRIVDGAVNAVTGAADATTSAVGGAALDGVLRQFGAGSGAARDTEASTSAAQ